MQWLGARCCCGVRARVIDIAFFGLEEDFPAGARIRGACSGKKLVDGCGGWSNRIFRWWSGLPLAADREFQTRSCSIGL
jgi:hypothetical protein